MPDEAQLGVLITTTRGSRWEVPIVLSVGTGMRRSEVLVVEWRDVDSTTLSFE